MRARLFSLAVLVSIAGCAQGGSLTGGGSDPSDGGSGPEGGSSSQGGFGPQGGNNPQGGSNPQGGNDPQGGSTPNGGNGTGGAGPGCGNGTVDIGEACDGLNLDGETCQSQGFDGGSLACTASCASFNTAGCSNTCTLVNLLTNGGFESGPNGGGWTETSTNFGSPVCDTASCGLGGGTGPFAGTYWVWIGGTATAAESASVSRAVVIPTGMASLSFEFDLPICEDPGISTDTFSVTLDGTVLFSASNSDAGCGSVGYQLVTVDISSFANGASHTLSFAGSTDDFVDVTNFFVDDVQLMGCQ